MRRMVKSCGESIVITMGLPVKKGMSGFALF
jgi:hypothetical protein